MAGGGRDVVAGARATVAVLAGSMVICAGWTAAVGAAAVGAQEVIDSTYSVDGQTVLVHEVVVPAPVDSVWHAFTTRQGLETWAVPFARVDLRLGGLWESSYDPAAAAGDSANIRTRFLAVLPRRMLAMQAVDAPPDFPHPDVLPDLFSVVELEPAGAGRTRVIMYGVGYRDTPAHQAVLEMFRDANGWTLAQLRRRFLDGPVDWAEVLGGGA